MRHGQNVLRVGSPGSGKTVATAVGVANSDGAELILDPHPDGLAAELLPHVTGNVLYLNLSDVRHTLGFDLLVPSRHPDPLVRAMENQLKAEAFEEILLRPSGMESLGGQPLKQEWVSACLGCYLNQRECRLPPTAIGSLLTPASAEFDELVKNCTVAALRSKFLTLKKLTPRGLRGEVGSTVRLLEPVFKSAAFAAACRGGFDLGAFFAKKGRLIVEKGRLAGESPMRVIMGALTLLTWAYAENRGTDLPTVRVRIDEAANAGLLGRNHEVQGAAVTNKWGLYWEYNLQRDPGGGLLEDLLQLCHRHEFFLCSERSLARKAAIDFDAGLPPVGDEDTRAQRVERLTGQFMNLRPGEVGVRDKSGARFERVPRLENPWPDFPGLRQAKLKEKLACLFRRPEYRASSGGGSGIDDSTASSGGTAAPPNSSGDSSSSPADRWRRR